MSCYRTHGLAVLEQLRGELLEAERCAAKGCADCAVDAAKLRALLAHADVIGRVAAHWHATRK